MPLNRGFQPLNVLLNPLIIPIFSAVANTTAAGVGIDAANVVTAVAGVGIDAAGIAIAVAVVGIAVVGAGTAVAGVALDGTSMPPTATAIAIPARIQAFVGADVPPNA